MKYLEIKSIGEIEPEAISLMGASTKRNDSSSIGMFGSGNKFAVAFFVRNGIAPIIHSGTTEITIGSTTKTFRGQEFETITVNGQETSLTTSMGKDWECWMAIREIYANALDEGGATIEQVDSPSVEAGYTSFCIPINDSVREFRSSISRYFSTFREPLFECKTGRLFSSDKSLGVSIYRKGIRCLNADKPSIFDYDFEDIEITEDRLVKYSWSPHELAFMIIEQLTDINLINTYLANITDLSLFENTPNSMSDISFSKCGEVWERAIAGTYFCPNGISGFVKDSERGMTSFINEKVYKALEARFGKDILPPSLRASGSLRFKIIDHDSWFQKKIDGAVSFCKAGGVHADDYEICVAEFFDKDILGEAANGKIILSDRVMTMGQRQIVSTIIEEYLHLKTGASDETRQFQDATINLIITLIEERVGTSI